MLPRFLFVIAIAAVSGLEVLAQPRDTARPRALPHYRAGYDELRSEQWDKAAASFQRAIDVDPSFEMAYYGLGRALMPQKKYAEAAAALTRCRDLYREEAGKHYANVQEAQRYRANRLTEIDEMLRQVQSAPQTAQTSEQARQLHEQRRQIQDAMQRGNLLTADSPVPPWVSLALGSAFFRMERFPDAEREYKAALDADPKTGEAHNNLAVVYLLTGRFDEAQKSIDQARKVGFKVNPQLEEDIKSKKRGS